MKQKRPRLNSTQRKILKGQLLKRDGDRCRVCSVLDRDADLEVDRKDRTKDYTLANTQLLCHPCNSQKDTRGAMTFQLRKIRTVDDTESPRTSSFEMLRNLYAEPRFRVWLWRQVMKRGVMRLSDAVNAGAEHSGCSPQTARRYIDKMCSAEGPLMLDKTEDQISVITMRHDPAQADAVLEQEDERQRIAAGVLKTGE
jgi:hypothetical protein